MTVKAKTAAAVAAEEATHYEPIEHHGVIGDLQTVALVAVDGAIDYLCLPDLDSPSIFASLLDAKGGGRFAITPLLEGARRRQFYLPDSNILITRALTEGGVAEISDFMPIRADDEQAHTLIRRVKTVRGEVRYRMLCDPRFDYARRGHRVEIRKSEALFVPEGKGVPTLRFHTAVPVREHEGALVAEFTLRAGESASFVLDVALPGQPSLWTSPDSVPNAFKDTMNYWRSWVGRSTYKGRWREMVNRSALTLKMLTSQPHGSIAAAATFGLPEELGGERNWDYRYTWIRDASFTLYALMRLGYTEEAGAFMKWLESRCGELNPDGSLQIMYGLDGRHELPEESLSHLEGYKGSSPVRIGNGAYDQLQLDIYGELLDSVYLYNKFGEPISYDLWTNLVRLLNWVVDHWRHPDEGIWEVRGGRREFLYSRLMCWVALDRGLRLARSRSFPCPRDRWLKARDDIYQDIFETFWDPRLQAFIQAKGLDALDASSLMMPLVKFMGPRDPRWLSTLGKIEERLVDDSLVYRYCPATGSPDGLHGTEGTFNMCTFWYVECLSRAGDVQRARFFFEKMLGYANHLGLYAEELGPHGEHLGNFPQAFTHLGLISAAYNLDRRLSAER
jgi:GH15 family glucan-1,4-alpha-glucosidase